MQITVWSINCFVIVKILFVFWMFPKGYIDYQNDTIYGNQLGSP